MRTLHVFPRRRSPSRPRLRWCVLRYLILIIPRDGHAVDILRGRHSILHHLILVLIFVLTLLIFFTDTSSLNIIITFGSKIPNIEKGVLLGITGGDTESLIKDDLPNTRNIREQVPNDSSIPCIPHLERTIRARTHLQFVMLKTCYCTSVCRKHMLQGSLSGIPNPEGGVRCSGDEGGRREGE